MSSPLAPYPIVKLTYDDKAEAWSYRQGIFRSAKTRGGINRFRVSRPLSS
jgi:hypothetical protein